MAYKLFLRIKNIANASTLSWVMLNDDGSVEDGIVTETENRILKLADAAQQITVLVPTVDVLLTQAKLPKLSTSKLLKALPYALEDQLTEDPMTMHFAFAENVRGMPLSIAAVSKEKIHEWQVLLKHNLGALYNKIKAFYPDVLALPLQNEAYDVVIDKDTALVRTGKQSGFMIEKDALLPMLQLMLNRANTLKPTAITILANDGEHEFTPEQLAQISIPVHLANLPDSVDVFLAKSLNTSTALNLLQGSYLPAQRKATFEQIIWSGFAIIGVWLAILTVTDLASFILLHRERKTLDQEMQTIYASIYPNKAMPDNPKLVLQKELSSLRASRADSSFTRLLSMAGPSIAEYADDGLNLKTLSFKNNQIVLEVEADDLTLLDKLRSALEGLGLKVVMSNAQRGAQGLTETRFTVEEMS